MQLNTTDCADDPHSAFPSAQRYSTGFLKFTLRTSVEFAIVNDAAVVTLHEDICKDAGIALGAVAPTPLKAIETEESTKGKVVEEKTIIAAAKAEVKDAKPMRVNGYKLEIIKALVRKAPRSVLH